MACAGDGTGPWSPPASIAGSWSSWGPNQKPTPAGPMGFLLSESGDTVSGVSSFGGQRWSVSGQYARPTIALTLTDVNGHVSSRVGKAINGGRIELNGTTFYRQ
ncbi:MAG TPA: hypothetical protein VFA43_21360 [Gemmatimonadaceae bacterium]|nr:hypothetical protein [Gemmatimonadaceae bacterium]